MSGTIGEVNAVEAMRSGAADFVLKDKLARLVPAIEHEIREVAERGGWLKLRSPRASVASGVYRCPGSSGS